MERPNRNAVKMILASNAPPIYRTASFENFECRTPELERAKNRVLEAYAKEESLFMFGKTWIGKTHLALAWVNRAIHQGYSGVYLGDSSELRKFHSVCLSAKLLVID